MMVAINRQVAMDGITHKVNEDSPTHGELIPVCPLNPGTDLCLTRTHQRSGWSTPEIRTALPSAVKSDSNTMEGKQLVA